MPRPVLDEAAIHPAIQQKVANLNNELLRQVQAEVASNAVMVFGMAGNPWVGKARKTLDAAGVAHGYLEIGSYFSQWRRRNALKMWTGWPTFPMVFVRGVLVGGAQDVQRLAETGELKQLLAA
ncbi:glutaredoxin domain-containing protein [Hydrogenophaga sp. PBL-H3]|uniref:glutaredoxin domain-containing protein n=1 Tax=Hydrogenophaga sp. PBL-H3 TaxID=434010 RepID=UPI00131FBFEC|nr:glutaredoxin domain-containing protein [Hydrogenophaga sp. PBL-H3]QHE75404.1 glutaredoxin [Hydrogenophaga sp. PBL-H3]QHE79831.1 glutaredoxin [Hydrogenophaga sp. PBL-H3]